MPLGLGNTWNLASWIPDMKMTWLLGVAGFLIAALGYQTLECDEQDTASWIVNEQNWYQFWSKAELNQIGTLVGTISSFYLEIWSVNYYISIKFNIKFENYI
ncbi:hypothetical protein RCL_jg6897.t1 [Rhizophagus clarus]|uniref:Uncharacterized protein n=1 Tax=Rhizophagus clarus TaxID=94130 RepID=A0A8H3L9P8_9GLOM|nr:hypothetical protein RCL_jg6897.t1 [Rhizophagus clarus]